MQLGRLNEFTYLKLSALAMVDIDLRSLRARIRKYSLMFPSTHLSATLGFRRNVAVKKLLKTQDSRLRYGFLIAHTSRWTVSILVHVFYILLLL